MRFARLELQAPDERRMSVSSRRISYIAEFVGTAFLLMIVVDRASWVRLAQGNTAVTLLVNSLATGAGLFVLIQCLGPISGAHLNRSCLWIFGGRLDRRGLFLLFLAVFGRCCRYGLLTSCSTSRSSNRPETDWD